MSHSISDEFSLSELIEALYHQEKFEGNTLLTMKTDLIQNICLKIKKTSDLIDFPKQYYDWFLSNLDKWYSVYNISEVYDVMITIEEAGEIKSLMSNYSEFNQGRRSKWLFTEEDDDVFEIPKAERKNKEKIIDDVISIEEWLSLGPQREAAVRRMLSSYKTGERTATRDMLGINQRGRFPSRKFDKAMEFKPKRNN